MPTVFSHAIAAAALGRVYAGRSMPRRFWVWSAACAMLPDADVIGFAVGIRYADMLGHRGLSHSFAFAAIAGIVVAMLYDGRRRCRWPLAVYFAVVTASHALLDALTNGGLGVALFAPFSSERFFFSWRPIAVSPIGARFFSARGVNVLVSEFWWIWLPAGAIVVAAAIGRRMKS